MAILACLLLLSPGVAWSGDGGGRPSIVRVQPDRIRQGGVGFVEIESRGPVQVRLGSRELPLQRLEGGRRAVAWFGVDLETPPGALALRVEGQAGDGQPAVLTRTLTVLDGRFPVQRLTLPRTFVDLDPAAQERAAREKAILDRLWATVSPDRLWRGPFRPPLDSGAGPQGFGLRRIINGEPRAPHTGVDFSAAEGTAVFAAHGGVVALSEEHFFGGQSLVLDHGLGLYTMYFHLQERLVRVGAVVAQGERIGRVGRTGRATGPHLHWGARLLGARVDPAELLRLAPE
jgi:murein DD-endopeptidase MepM/ murein hydrolase activator NlpD